MQKICRFWQKVAKIFANMALLLYLRSENKHKTTKINDQRMKINEVIERHGMQLRDVSREMGMKPSALQSAIDRNLTVKTLRQISEAARIPIAEFFFDELTDGERQQLLAALQPSAQPSQQPAAGTEPEEKDDALPFGNSSQPIPADAPTRSLSALAHQASLQQAIICPHCHQALVMNIASYEQK